jgi:hypothetical protein
MHRFSSIRTLSKATDVAAAAISIIASAIENRRSFRRGVFTLIPLYQDSSAFRFIRADDARDDVHRNREGAVTGRAARGLDSLSSATGCDSRVCVDAVCMSARTPVAPAAAAEARKAVSARRVKAMVLNVSRASEAAFAEATAVAAFPWANSVAKRACFDPFGRNSRSCSFSQRSHSGQRDARHHASATQPAPQSLACSSQPALKGAKWPAQTPRRCIVGQSLEITERNGQSVMLGESVGFLMKLGKTIALVAKPLDHERSKSSLGGFTAACRDEPGKQLPIGQQTHGAISEERMQNP